MSTQCNFNNDGICLECGIPLSPRFDPRTTFRQCKNKIQPVPHPPRRGLGSSLARVFHFFGFEQTPGCGCIRREEMLNRFGQLVHFTCIVFWNAVFPFWAKKLPYVLPPRKKKQLTLEQVAAKYLFTQKMQEKQATSKNS